MAAPAAVAVHNNLASGQAAVPVGAAYHKAAGGVDEVLAVFAQLLRDHGLDDIFLDVLVNLLLGGLFPVLGAYHNGGDFYRSPVLVPHCHLGLAVGAQVGEGAVLADLGELPGQAVGVGDGHRHQLQGLVTGVAEHHSLVPGAVLLFRLPGLRLGGVIHPQGDIRGLLVDGGDDPAGGPVKAVGGVVVADIQNNFPHQLLNIHIAMGGHLADDLDQAGGAAGLAGHPAHGVLPENRVQDAVGNLVANLVGVALGHRFAGEVVVTHGFVLLTLAPESLEKRHPEKPSGCLKKSHLPDLSAGFSTLPFGRLPGFPGPVPSATLDKRY